MLGAQRAGTLWKYLTSKHAVISDSLDKGLFLQPPCNTFLVLQSTQHMLSVPDIHGMCMHLCVCMQVRGYGLRAHLLVRQVAARRNMSATICETSGLRLAVANKRNTRWDLSWIRPDKDVSEAERPRGAT